MKEPVDGGGAFSALPMKARIAMRRAVAAAVGVATMAAVMVAPQVALAADAGNGAKATASTNPYVDVTITKVADGTGHGTAAQTFVNSKNGFTPGDNTPTDGVVSSYDTVTYELDVRFTAAGSRTVTIGAPSSSKSEYLGDIAFGCVSGHQVSATRNSDGSCTYTVPAGATERLKQTITVPAKDTAGTAKENQTFDVGVWRGEVAYSKPFTTVHVDPVTVVSAPRADLVVTTNRPKRDIDTAYVAQEQGKTASGSFKLAVDQLTYPNYSGVKGVSKQTKWDAELDLSAFPDGTVFTTVSDSSAVSFTKTAQSTVWELTGGGSAHRVHAA